MARHQRALDSRRLSESHVDRRRWDQAATTAFSALASPRRYLDRALERRYATLLHDAGLQIDGPRRHDPQIHERRLYLRLLTQGSLGAGEAYVEGWWDCDQLDEMFTRILRRRLDVRVGALGDRFAALRGRLTNLQRRARAFMIGERHYDLGNDLFEAMLDRRMTYSCGYWRRAHDLDSAQEAKLDLICRKLGIEPGMHVLDIGCGWGGTARYIAEHRGAHVVGITVSREQAEHARDLCRGLPVEIRLEDYRQLDGRFDRALSVGMFEHVGVKNYRTFLRVIRRVLESNGLFLLHTIGGNLSTSSTDRWIERHIFPNSMLPSAAQIAAASEDLFVIEDWHNFGADYDRTLMAWYANFEGAWDRLAGRYGDRFRRMWRYYLLTCAATFRARTTQLWQLVLSPAGLPGGYLAPR